MEECIMTREETIDILMSVQAAFPNFRVPDKTIAVNTWFSLLKEYSYEQVDLALKRYIKTNKNGFAPSIGQIIDQICSIYSDDDINEMAAWGMVLKALRKSTYHSEEEFDKLPPSIQRAVASPRQLYEWATMENLDGTGLNVIQSNFMRTYRLEVEREKECQKLSPELLKLMRKQSDNIGISCESSNQINAPKVEAFPIDEAIPVPDRVKERKKELFGNLLEI